MGIAIEGIIRPAPVPAIESLTEQPASPLLSPEAEAYLQENARLGIESAARRKAVNLKEAGQTTLDVLSNSPDRATRRAVEMVRGK